MMPGIGSMASSSSSSAVKTVFITASGAYTIPADFSSLISIEGIGAGAGGMVGALFNPGDGGGGGAYAKNTTLTGLTAGGTVYVQCGVGGSSGNSGTDTWFNKSANSAPTLSSDGILAKAGQINRVGGSAGSSLGDVTRSGGGSANDGGGGAAGPDADGGAGSTSAGGDGNGGQAGGGAGGIDSSGQRTGAAGTYWTQTSNGATAGPGGGGADGGTASTGGSGGLYGGGGGGGGDGEAGGAGRNGIVVFTYRSV